MPVQLYDSKTGAPASVDASKAQAGVLDGTYAPKPDDLVHVVLADGRKGTVAGHELAATLGDGAQILDPEVEHHKQVREEQSGFGGGVGAAVGGAFNGATGGLGLGAIRQGIKAFSPEAGKDFQETVEAQREEHPIAAVGGEVAGAAGLAYLAHRSPAARFAPAAGIDALGAMAERNVGAAVAGVGSATARAAATTAARAGAEGALYGAGTHVGEDMLGDVPTAGDKLLVATAKGGAFGLGLGGVLGGAGSLIKGARGAAARGGSAIISDAAAEMTTAAEQRLAAAEAAHADATKRSFSYRDVQGSPVELDVHGGQMTEAPAVEKAFDIRKGVQHPTALDPHAGIAGETEDALSRGLGGGQLPKPFDIGGSLTKEHSPSPFVRASSQKGVRLGPMAEYGDTATASPEMDVFGTKTTNDVHLKPSGIDALKPSTERPIYMPEPLEDPIVAARKAAVEQELVAARKEFEEATQAAEHAVHLQSLASEIRSGDPHSHAAQFAWQSTGAGKGLSKKLGPEGVIERGKTMLRMGILDVGEGQGAVKATLGSISENTPENMLTRTQTKLAELVNQLDTIGGTKTTATLGELLAPMDAQIKSLEKVSTTVPVAARLRAQRQALLGTPKFRNLLDVDGNLIAGAEKTPVSLSDIIAERRGVGRTAFAVGDVNAHTIKASNAELYAKWSALEEEALDRASHLGIASGAEFKSLKTDVSHLIDIEKALENRIAGATAGRSHGILDHLAGSAASAAGGAVLPFGGHIVGHGIGMILSKSIRERGNAAAAVALTKIADIGAVKHLMGTVDKAVGKAAKGLTSTERVARSGAKAPARESLSVRYREAEAKLSAMENQHSTISERAMASTRDLAQHAPNVSQAFAMSMARAAAFLSSKRPQPLMPADPYTNRAPSILDTDKLSFLRSYEAVTNPMGVLERFERGEVRIEDAEALKATAPKVYEELQAAVMKEVGMRHAQGKPMPFKKRVEMGLLFDVPADPCLDKQTYKALQQNVFTPPQPQQPPSGGGKSNAPRRPVKNMPSPLDTFVDETKKAGRR